jgi:hypothetical protein
VDVIRFLASDTNPTFDATDADPPPEAPPPPAAPLARDPASVRGNALLDDLLRRRPGSPRPRPRRLGRRR